MSDIIFRVHVTNFLEHLLVNPFTEKEVVTVMDSTDTLSSKCFCFKRQSRTGGEVLVTGAPKYFCPVL